MKKVKLMLLGAVIFASVGGALAFKAKGESLFCGTTTTSCPIPTTAYKLQTSPSVSGVFCSTVENGACTSVTNND